MPDVPDVPNVPDVDALPPDCVDVGSELKNDEVSESIDSGRNIYALAVKNAPMKKSRKTARKRIDSLGSLVLYCCNKLAIPIINPPRHIATQKPGLE